MKARKIVASSSKLSSKILISQLALRLVIFSILLVLFSTLFPFNFLFQNGISVQEIASQFNKNSSDLYDQIGNVLLFLPLGFGLGGLLRARKLGVTVRLALVLIISATLSFTVEVSQVFLPLRVSTITDIITNTLGGGFGFLCFHLWRETIISYILVIIERSKKGFYTKKLTVAFIGYIVLLCLIAIALPTAMNLRSWDTAFPLLLGNERTGDRPWQGYVSQLYIADRASSKEEVARAFSDKSSFTINRGSLLAAYQLTGKGNYRDQTGHLPDLIWRGQPPNTQDENGVSLGSSHWLETATPATSLTQKIRETSQFTLNLTVATASPTQAGPARIVSLSSDPKHRNFTLGQDKTDLVFRLRTLISGENGAKPEIAVPGLFADSNPHQIIITYDGLFLRIYKDKLENLHSFEIAPMSYKILYYELIFVPLGFLLALVLTFYKGRFIFYIFLLCTGILLPSLIVEGIFASGSGRSINSVNLLISVLVTAGTLLVFTVRTPSYLQKNSLQRMAKG